MVLNVGGFSTGLGMIGVGAGSRVDSGISCVLTAFALLALRSGCNCGVGDGGRVGFGTQ